MEKKDLIIIGTGPGGYDVAVKAAKAGLQVAIFEKQHYGGTCLNVGCIPTKTLCKNAELLEEIKAAEQFGIDIKESSLNMSHVIARKNGIVEKLSGAIEALMKTPGITFVKGDAQFIDTHTIGAGGQVFTAPNIIIATGSTTKFLPIEGAHCKGVVTSTEMLNLEFVPKRLCVIGGGVIGLEFASIFNTFGSQVTVVEFCKEILPPFDRDIAKRLRTILKKKGIDFKIDSAVIGIQEADDAYLVEFEEKGEKKYVTSDLVLMAVGREANLSSLNLDKVGIHYTKKGVKVDEYMQTNVPGIYAVGDINGRMQLAHAATFQSYVALDHILGVESRIHLHICPAIVFTSPEVAMIGKTEEELKSAEINYEVHKSMYRANGKALTMGCDEGIVKVLTDTDGHILGAHILGTHAADLIHECALVMNESLTIDVLRNTIHAHPSLSEIIMKI